MRALISVSNKEGIVELARQLRALKVELVSTGGTCQLLKDSGIKVQKVSEVTGFEEILDGRVKTLHPRVHGGILADRDNPEHLRQLKANHIEPLDLVIVNLYPFREVVEGKPACDELIENIDIGGPAMLRAAAKNHKHVTVVVEPGDYQQVLSELKAGGVTMALRKKLAVKAFEHTANYDTLIGATLRDRIHEEFEQHYFNFSFSGSRPLRYGENPHQGAVYYGEAHPLGCLQLSGKELSYNNLNDVSRALGLLREFTLPTSVNLKHGNPCGVASAENISQAYQKAYEADPVSVFGGIVALNGKVEEALARQLYSTFLEIVIAEEFSDGALKILSEKKNLRLLKSRGHSPVESREIRSIPGGILVQERDQFLLEKFEVVTREKPTVGLIDDLHFAYKVVKHQNSNAICIASNLKTLGLGTGQVSRVQAVKNALEMALEDTEGAVLASDAFFPFRDAVDMAARKGIKAIIQPGGSLRDREIIDACDEQGIVMIFTGLRHFKH
ncbi:MAG: bifunctional phosphoribosylaminoimidazolecarboxamide formyltransferase/inosine monophosphate cyclohydrolase [delta proteobacterium ML8_F1]|nr:MAG: bifunctional phosphoribosylaminoimidazolecarboxamide formyltransferase/inosine monophosphate cyclohydrolase [delta proteobacterium ML8_F1]